MANVSLQWRINAACREAGLPVREVDRSELDGLAADHRGVVAKVSVPSELGERDLASFPFSDEAVVVVLDGIEDPQNLGAAARVADGAGAAMLVTRVRRAAAVTPSAVRTSAGALITLPHARVANITRAIERLKDNGFTVVGLDDAARVGIFDEPCPAGRIAVVVGAEGTGMGRLVREACDLTVSLPMRGQVASLNAATALAAFLYAYVLAARTQG
jgi:23S rRNA (guanosine2251-2'-O)-methyltransferase